jgi:hypothetical protein
MLNDPTTYVIYRVYEMLDGSAKLRISEGTKDFARTVLDVLRRLPNGVQSDGISVRPSALQFGAEIPLSLPMDAVLPA